MKYTIEGFSQQALVDNGLDARDAAFLRWFVDFQASEKMLYTEDDEGRRYYWIKHSTVSTEMPILGLHTADSVKKYLGKLVSSGILQRKTVRRGRERGSASYYHVDGKILYSLTHSPAQDQGDVHPPVNDQGDVHPPTTGGRASPCDSSIRDSSINNKQVDVVLNEVGVVKNSRVIQAINSLPDDIDPEGFIRYLNKKPHKGPGFIVASLTNQQLQKDYLNTKREATRYKGPEPCPAGCGGKLVGGLCRQCSAHVGMTAEQLAECLHDYHHPEEAAEKRKRAIEESHKKHPEIFGIAV
jgi:hypothetical protein